MLQIVNTTLGSAVADAGTFTVSYPAGTNVGTYFGGSDHAMSVAGVPYVAPRGFTLTFNAANITVTNNSGVTWASGSRICLELAIPGERLARIDARETKRFVCGGGVINLEAPIAAAAAGIAASQSVGLGANFLINGAQASGGQVILDVPRNVVAAWTTASVVTVYGEDEYGNAMVEASASGTALTGKKAFKKITRITSSAAITLATVGTGNVLGLPVFLPAAGYIVKELQDGAAAGAGTVVAAVTAKPTATTGDVRGTYVPAVAPDGVKTYQLVVALQDVAARGAVQFAG